MSHQCKQPCSCPAACVKSAPAQSPCSPPSSCVCVSEPAKVGKSSASCQKSGTDAKAKCPSPCSSPCPVVCVSSCESKPTCSCQTSTCVVQTQSCDCTKPCQATKSDEPCQSPATPCQASVCVVPYQICAPEQCQTQTCTYIPIQLSQCSCGRIVLVPVSACGTPCAPPATPSQCCTCACCCKPSCN